MICSWLLAAPECATNAVIRDVPGAAAALIRHSRVLEIDPKSVTSHSPPSAQRFAPMYAPLSVRIDAAVLAPWKGPLFQKRYLGWLTWRISMLMVEQGTRFLFSHGTATQDDLVWRNEIQRTNKLRCMCRCPSSEQFANSLVLLPALGDKRKKSRKTELY